MAKEEGETYFVEPKVFDRYFVANNMEYYTMYVETYPEFFEENDVNTLEEFFDKENIDAHEVFVPENADGSKNEIDH